MSAAVRVLLALVGVIPIALLGGWFGTAFGVVGLIPAIVVGGAYGFIATLWAAGELS